MNIQKIGVVLLALLLAAMAMVPMVSAGNVISSGKMLTGKYFQDLPQPSIKSFESKMTGISRPEINEYSLVTVDPAAFVHDAETGNKITMSFNGKNYIVEMTPVKSIIAPDAKLIIKTEKGTTVTDLPRIKQFRCNIPGIQNSGGGFTVDDNVILGQISIGNDTYIIDQYGAGDDGKVIHIIYNSKNEIQPKNRPLPGSNDLFLPEGQSSKNITLMNAGSGNQESTVRATTSSAVTILAVYDTQFRNSYPYASTAITSMMNSVNNAFSPSYIGVNLQIRGFVWDSTLSSTNKDTLLTQLANSERSNRDSTSSDLVFLFTGRNLDGNAIGNAVEYSNGVQELSAYSLAEMVNTGETTYTASSTQRPVLIAHELGHNFGGMHEYLESGLGGYPYYVPSYARATWYFQAPYVEYRKTALIAPFYGDSMVLEFSSPVTGHGDTSHDNARRISEVKSAVAAYR